MASDEQSYKVGYGKPPRHTRWQKGQSGNPKGRRKGSRHIRFAELLKKALTKKVKVRKGGKVVSLSRLETGIEQFANKVGQGDFQTFRFMMLLGDKMDLQELHDRHGNNVTDLSDAKRRLRQMLGLNPAEDDE